MYIFVVILTVNIYSYVALRNLLLYRLSIFINLYLALFFKKFIYISIKYIGCTNMKQLE